MKGLNDLILNEATMIEAVQFWLDSKMVLLAPKVVGVKVNSDSYSLAFRVSLDADADRTDPQRRTLTPEISGPWNTGTLD
jgi:hypothetical protein